MGESVARGWRELSGESNWEGMLPPDGRLDPDLRRYIIHYGQMAGAVGDLFNSRTGKRYDSEEEFFAQACLVKGNPYEYKVTRFIYAGSESVETAWIGYVAVATDQGKRVLGRRDILIAWRGTVTPSEWRNNLRVAPRATASDIFPDMTRVKVHRGFHSLYTGPTRHDSPHNGTSAREQVLDAVEELVNTYEDEEISITVTGFSLGAALATLTAMDIVIHGYNESPNGEPFMVTVFTFGGPRVGNRSLARELHTLGLENLRLLRIINRFDVIPNLPTDPFSYPNLGKELSVNTSKSKFLKRSWIALLHLIIPIWNDIKGRRDQYQTLCWFCYLTSMYMVYERLWLLLLVLIGILFGAEKNRRVGNEYGDWRLVCYVSSLPVVYESNRILLLVIIMLYIGLEIKTIWDRNAGSRSSTFRDLYISHNMDVYLHGVAIKDIQENTPVDELDHDIALVNKHQGRVRDEYGFPPHWWPHENRRGMVQRVDGRWRMDV